MILVFIRAMLRDVRAAGHVKSADPVCVAGGSEPRGWSRVGINGGSMKIDLHRAAYFLTRAKDQGHLGCFATHAR
jgi:hypothetical protein